MVQIKQKASAGFFSVADAAKFLDVSERVIRKLVRDGLLQSYRVGRCIKIADLQLIAFLENSQVSN